MIFGRLTECSGISTHYVIVTYEHGDRIPNLGDKVWLGGRMWEIRGIEMRKTLMDPPRIKNDVVFRLREVA